MAASVSTSLEGNTREDCVIHSTRQVPSAGPPKILRGSCPISGNAFTLFVRMALASIYRCKLQVTWHTDHGSAARLTACPSANLSARISSK